MYIQLVSLAAPSPKNCSKASWQAGGCCSGSYTNSKVVTGVVLLFIIHVPQWVTKC